MARRCPSPAEHLLPRRSYLNQGLNPEWLRYYYAAKLNDTMEDIDLNFDDFIARVNSDLVGKYINIASRCSGFITKKFGGKLTATISEAKQKMVQSIHILPAWRRRYLSWPPYVPSQAILKGGNTARQ